MWNVLFDKGIITASALLAILGAVIKYRTGTNNELICLIISIVSILTWIICGVIVGDGGFLSILWNYGFKRGLLSAGLSVFSWDFLHGTLKYAKEKKNE